MKKVLILLSFLISLSVIAANAQDQEITERYVYPSSSELVVTNEVIWNYSNPSIE